MRNDEYGQEHEQHVDHRCDVHVGVRLRDLSLEDSLGAVMLMDRHYSPPAVPAEDCFGSVISPMSSIPAMRSWSIVSITALYSTSSSALMITIFSVLFSRIASIRLRKVPPCTSMD